MSTSKVTEQIVKYPIGQEPNFVIPQDYQPYRFVLGKNGTNPLLAICMNPSAAREELSDRTVNIVIKTAEKFGYDGWIVVNLYPERATDSGNMDKFNEELHRKNMEVIANVIDEYHIEKLWGAWGNMPHKNLGRAKKDLMKLLQEKNIKIFHFGKLSKSGNPHHPLYLKIEADSMYYFK
ncbi:hypothetical protein FACS1894153_3970 [Bacteroidia bacterium]|nr:hypothetical protein FACS1894153_3970 [Bacteroidia bacterium]